MNICQLVKIEDVSVDIDYVVIKIEDYPIEHEVDGDTIFKQEKESMGVDYVEEEMMEDTIEHQIPQIFQSKISHIVEHQRTHYGEKLFNCSICNKSFAQKSTLVQH